MTRSDLQDGMLVLNSKGSYGLVMTTYSGHNRFIKFFRNKDGNAINKYMTLNYGMTEDMRFLDARTNDRTNRIIKVFKPKHLEYRTMYSTNLNDYECIYEEPVKEMSVKELEELLGCRIKIVKEN